jgi:hypothetical protein
MMFVTIKKAYLEAYSLGRMSRRDIQEKMGEPVSFGAVLSGLHAHGLPLPRYPVNRDSPGYKLVKELAEQSMRRG